MGSQLRRCETAMASQVYIQPVSILHLKQFSRFIPFATSYLCEIGVSAVAIIKQSVAPKISVEREMHLAVSNITPHFVPQQASS